MSLEAEHAALGHAIQSAEAFEKISAIVSSADFFDETNRCVWDATAALRTRGRNVDSVVLGSLLDRSSRWQAIARTGGYDWVETLLAAMPGLHLCVDYAEIVRKESFNRQLVDYADTVRGMAQTDDLDPDQKLGQIHTLLTPLTMSKVDDLVSAKQAAGEAWEEIRALMERGGGISGLATGIPELDEMMSGLQPADLIILAGRPSMGKTLLATKIADACAATVPVQFYSLEMPRMMIAKRSLSKFGRINFTDLKNGHMDEHALANLLRAKNEYSALDLHIDDQGGISVDQLIMRVRVSVRKKRPGLIVIDYLQLLDGKGDNDNAKISYVSRMLKVLAKELNIPIIAISQLNRGLENRPDKRPKMSDLRESGAIEQDADVILFVYRDDVYNGEDSPHKGLVEIICRKHRNGPLFTIFQQAMFQYQDMVQMTGAVPPIEKPSKGGSMANFIKGNSAANSFGEGF